MPKHLSTCQWPKTKAWSACTQCMDKCIKCWINGVPVSNCVQRRVGPLLSKRRWMTTPEILEMGSETAEVRKTLKSSGREQVHWVIAHALEDLVGEQAQLWESVEQQEALLEEMVSNTKVIADTMDLFTWGERFLRVWEMGKLEGLEETELVVRRHRRRMGKGKGKEPEKNPEVVPEGVQEVEPEASCDVEMTKK